MLSEPEFSQGSATCTSLGQCMRSLQTSSSSVTMNNDDFLTGLFYSRTERQYFGKGNIYTVDKHNSFLSPCVDTAEIIT